MYNRLLAKYTSLFNAAKTANDLESQVKKQQATLKQAQANEKHIRNGKPYILILITFIIGVYIGGLCIDSIDSNVVGGVLFIIFFIGSPILGYLLHCALFEKKNTDKADAYINDTIVPMKERLRHLKEQLQVAKQNPDFLRASDPAEIPECYQTLAALEFFVSALQARRADTEKELYNLYEEQLRHEQVMAEERKRTEEERKRTEETARHNQEIERTLEQAGQNLSDISDVSKKVSKQVRYGNIVNTVSVIKQFKDSKKK